MQTGYAGEPVSFLYVYQLVIPVTFAAPLDEVVDKVIYCEGKSYLNMTKMKRCSRINVVVRAVARVRKVLKNKSFKVKSPTFEDEEEAFKCLLKVEQSKMTKPPKCLLVRDVDGLQVTSQRWSPAEHLDLYRVPYLPVLPVGVRLGQLLLQQAHRPPAGPCAGERHTLLRLRTEKHPVFLFGKTVLPFEEQEDIWLCYRVGGSSYKHLTH